MVMPQRRCVRTPAAAIALVALMALAAPPSADASAWRYNCTIESLGPVTIAPNTSTAVYTLTGRGDCSDATDDHIPTGFKFDAQYVAGRGVTGGNTSFVADRCGAWHFSGAFTGTPEGRSSWTVRWSSLSIDMPPPVAYYATTPPTEVRRVKGVLKLGTDDTAPTAPVVAEVNVRYAGVASCITAAPGAMLNVVEGAWASPGAIFPEPPLGA